MSEKTPLALLPGLLLNEGLWAPLMPKLRVISEPYVADFTSQDSVAAMARSVLEAMPPRFALAALSMGGYVAFEILRQAPERVTKLALLDTQAPDDSEEVRQRRHALIDLAKIGKFKGVTPRLLPLLIHKSRLEDDTVTRPILDMAEAVGRDAFLRQQNAILTRPDSRPTLVKIACPTLVLCGRQDALTPLVRHTEMAAGIRNSRLTVIEDCGHLPPLEQPEETWNALERWLLSE
ncbi:alpha/beta fold hydrolase [Rhodovibrionaceae bacterium A322]